MGRADEESEHRGRGPPRVHAGVVARTGPSWRGMHAESIRQAVRGIRKRVARLENVLVPSVGQSDIVVHHVIEDPDHIGEVLRIATGSVAPLYLPSRSVGYGVQLGGPIHPWE